MIQDSPTQSKRILAFIPARGGSVGIPGKNIKDFCGKPLIAYTIEVAKESGIFDRIVVSTDSEEIAEVSKKYGAEVPYLRPAELATATANVSEAAMHMLNYLRDKEGYEPDLMYLLQTTSPLRDVGDIQKSLAIFEKEKAPALVSVCQTHHQTLNIQNGRLVVINPATEHVKRQELQTTYKQDGSMIYIVDVPYFREHKKFVPEGNTAAYIIPKWKAVDVDDMEDFELAEVLYKNRNSFKTA